MARTRQIARLISLLPFAFMLLATTPAHATDAVTITVWDNNTGYNQFNNAPPIPPTTPVAGTTTASTITHNFDAEPLFGLYEDFVVRFQTTINPPLNVPVRFYFPADDGVRAYINNIMIINDWHDKGGGGSVSAPITFTGSAELTVWFYENGGGAWIQALWLINNEWQQISSDAYGQPTTVPTTLPETTTSSSTTTTTVEEPPTTTLPQSTTTTTSEASVITPAESTTTHPVQTTDPTTTVPVTTVPATTSTVRVQTSVLPTTVPAIPTTTVADPVDETTTTTTDQTTTTTQPLQESTQDTLPNTPDFQSATLVHGGVIGKGLKPAALISNGLRKGVTPAQQRLVVTAAVIIAIPSPISVGRKRKQ